MKNGPVRSIAADACREVASGAGAPEAVDVPFDVSERIPVVRPFDLHSGDDQVVAIELEVHSFLRVFLEVEVLDGVSDFTALEFLKKSGKTM